MAGRLGYFATVIENNKFFSCQELNPFIMKLHAIDIHNVQAYKRTVRLSLVSNQFKQLGITDVKFFIRFLEKGVEKMRLYKGVVIISGTKQYNNVQVDIRLKPNINDNSSIMTFVAAMWCPYKRQASKLKTLKEQTKKNLSHKIYDYKDSQQYHRELKEMDYTIDKLKRELYIRKMMKPKQEEIYIEERRKVFSQGKTQTYEEKVKNLIIEKFQKPIMIPEEKIEAKVHEQNIESEDLQHQIEQTDSEDTQKKQKIPQKILDKKPQSDIKYQSLGSDLIGMTKIQTKSRGKVKIDPEQIKRKLRENQIKYEQQKRQDAELNKNISSSSCSSDQEPYHLSLKKSQSLKNEHTKPKQEVQSVKVPNKQKQINKSVPKNYKNNKKGSFDNDGY